MPTSHGDHHVDPSEPPVALLTLVRRLAEGDLDGARLGATTLPAGSPHRLLVEVDADMRELARPLADLYAELQRPDLAAVGTTPWLWARAVVAEQLLFEGDPVAFEVAEAALAHVPTDPFLEIPALYARARLRRVLSTDWRRFGAEGRRELVRLRDDAMGDLLRCGFSVEVELTGAIVAAAHALAFGEEPLEDLERLVRARARIEHMVPLWSMTLDHAIAGFALVTGDLALLFQQLDLLERQTGAPPALATIPVVIRAILDVIATDAEPAAVDELAGHLERVAAIHVRHARVWFIQSAHLLVDLGSPHARAFAQRGFDLPEPNPDGAVETELLRLRVETDDWEPVHTDRALDRLGWLVDAGRARTAGSMGLRLSLDLSRRGLPEPAAVLRNWGEAHLPAMARRTPWEQAMSVLAEAGLQLPEGSTAPSVRHAIPAVTLRAAGADGPTAVRVLTPRLSVRVAGRDIRLSDTPARLVLALVLAHPAPMHVERAGDLLWPGVGITAVRSRLNSVLYRLREATRPAGDLVARDGDLLSFQPLDARVDLHAFRRATRAGGQERAEALASVTGNLCDTQFPYDELFVAERHRFVAEWQHHARQALADGEVAVADLADAAAALGLLPADLLD